MVNIKRVSWIISEGLVTTVVIYLNDNDALKVSGTEIVEKLNAVEWLMTSGLRNQEKKQGHCYNNTFVHTTSPPIFYTFVPTNIQLLAIDVTHFMMSLNIEHVLMLLFFPVQYNLW